MPDLAGAQEARKLSRLLRDQDRREAAGADETESELRWCCAGVAIALALRELREPTFA